MLNIALFGPPGAGKGTQSKWLMKKYNLVYISTGDILRQEISEGTELGLKAKGIIEKGGLASDEIIVQIIERKIKMNPDVNGFLFDGFPRTYVQAYILEGLLLKLNTSLSCMLSLEVPKKMLVERMLERGKTSGRADDNIEVIQNRLKEYENKTVPVIDFYNGKNIYFPIDGVGSVEDVFKRLTDSISINLKKELFNVVIFGYPGSGRGTQAKKIAEKYNLVYISTGKLLREEIKKGTEVGKKAEEFMNEGSIVPDEIAIKIIERQIFKHPNANGFVFKGFPRTIVQAYILDGLLRRLDTSVSLMLELDVSMLDAIKRLNVRGKSHKKREYDLDMDVIINRMEVYQKKTVAVTNYYKRLNKMFTINGAGDGDEVFSRVDTVVGKASRELR